MSKRKKQAKGQPSQTAVHTVGLPTQLSADEMQRLIANAIVDAEKRKAEQEAEKRAAEQEEWAKTIGYDKTKTGIGGACNKVAVFCRLLFLRKKTIKGDRASVAIIQSWTALCFHVLRFVFLLAALASFLYPFASLAFSQMEPLTWWEFIGIIIIAGLLFFQSRIFRIAAIEAENMESRSDLFAIFAAITSFVSMAIAIIAVAKGG